MLIWIWVSLVAVVCDDGRPISSATYRLDIVTVPSFENMHTCRASKEFVVNTTVEKLTPISITSSPPWLAPPYLSNSARSLP